MKIFKNIALAILFGLLICSCKQESFAAEHMVISGKLKGSSGGELIVTSRDFKQVIPVKDDGEFEGTLNIKGGKHYIEYEKGGTLAYLPKSGNVVLTADGENFDKTVVFSGDYADLNNYYVEATNLQKFHFTNSEVYGKEEEAFLKAIDAEIKTFSDKLEAIAEIPAGIKEKELRHLKYLSLRNKIQYPAYHKRHPGNENYKASEAFEAYWDEIPLDSAEDYRYSGTYYSLFKSALQRTIEKSGNIDKYRGMDVLKGWNRAAFDYLKNEELSNMFIYDNYMARLYRTEDKKDVYEDFMKFSTNKSHREAITKLYNELTQLEAGSPSPKFVAYENHAGGTTSLEDFKGKYVYIDIWATWCSPCKAEIPFLQKLEKQYHDKNIEFVSISLDDREDHQAWKDMISEKQMTGMQLFADKSFDSEFIQAYKVNALPQFILIDPQGNIVQSQAPRPSDEKLIELFETLEL